MKTWAYDEPNKDGTNNHVVVTEVEILRLYWDNWEARMQIAVLKPNTMAYLMPELITKENCIDDWVSVNWAYEVLP